MVRLDNFPSLRQQITICLLRVCLYLVAMEAKGEQQGTQDTSVLCHNLAELVTIATIHSSLWRPRFVLWETKNTKQKQNKNTQKQTFTHSLLVFIFFHSVGDSQHDLAFVIPQAFSSDHPILDRLVQAPEAPTTHKTKQKKERNKKTRVEQTVQNKKKKKKSKKGLFVWRPFELVAFVASKECRAVFLIDHPK